MPVRRNAGPPASTREASMNDPSISSQDHLDVQLGVKAFEKRGRRTAKDFGSDVVGDVVTVGSPVGIVKVCEDVGDVLAPS